MDESKRRKTEHSGNKSETKKYDVARTTDSTTSYLFCVLRSHGRTTERVINIKFPAIEYKWSGRDVPKKRPFCNNCEMRRLLVILETSHRCMLVFKKTQETEIGNGSVLCSSVAVHSFCERMLLANSSSKRRMRSHCSFHIAPIHVCISPFSATFKLMGKRAFIIFRTDGQRQISSGQFSICVAQST